MRGLKLSTVSQFTASSEIEWTVFECTRNEWIFENVSVRRK